MPAKPRSTTSCTPRSADSEVSLPVLRGAAKPKKSRNGRRRAVVLILVHVIFIIHIAQWMLSGLRSPTGQRSTISPIEPSEAMYTLELGLVNAGFVFFVLAIIATLIFGRYFCGWGCHVVALQDLCAWAMRKARMRPKPFRSRLLVWAPLGLGVYMFIWPTFHREVLTRVIGAENMPVWLGQSAPFPGFQPHFVVEDFWATFPPWYVAIPFLFICGFAAVYFLGSKGFCTYGCPYGGFFALADKVSPGRIVVDDNCHQCGHCTAACTSNVRVHEEIRDYGMVVNPGCMKCMDCVSVCPNGALSFSFARPTAFIKPKDEAARERAGTRASRSHAFDLSIREEWVCAALFVGYLLAFRGMLGMVPLLMAAGMAGIATYGTWKLWSMARVPNVRLQNLQLRHKGRLTRLGFVFVPLMVLVIGGAVWSGVVRWNVWRGHVLDARIEVPMEVVFSPGYAPDDATARLASRAASGFERGLRPRDGGIGWGLDGDTTVRLAWMYAVLARFDDAERVLLDAVLRRTPSEGMIDDLAHLMTARGATPAELRDTLIRIIDRHPALPGVHLALAQMALAAGDAPGARSRITEAVALPTATARHHAWAGELLMTLGDGEAGLAAFRRATELEPRFASYWTALAMAHAALGQGSEGLEHMNRAAEIAPEDPRIARARAALLRALGQTREANLEDARARELELRLPGQK